MFQGDKHDLLLKGAASEIMRLTIIVSKLTRASPAPASVSAAYKEKSHNYEHQVYVGNMNPSTTTDDMKDYFKRFGSVADAFVVRKHERSQCGFVEFAQKDSVENALTHCSHVLNGRNIFVRRSARQGSKVDKENVAPKMKSEKTTSMSRYSPY